METPDIIIEKGCNNFKSIANNIINPKFKYIDSWVYKTSTKFKKENIKPKKEVYPRFDYGTITKVDFGINEGSELSGPHFAITLERYDSTKNPIITVLPLTSQDKELNLPLNELIVDEFTKRLIKSLNSILKDIGDLRLYSKKTDEILQKKEDDLKLIRRMIEYYSNYAKSSYACLNQITTISKNKIIRPKNQFDIIGRAKCSSKTMNFISNEIIKKFTNLSSKIQDETKIEV